MSDSYDVIKSPIVSEKGKVVLDPQNKYLFEVASTANKVQIRRAVEEIYKVKVEKVNTLMMAGKRKKVRYAEGRTPDWKKAIVTLKEGNKINLA